MNQLPEPPEGRLITAALQGVRPKLSVREAARRAGISEGWWRQIVKGAQPISGGGKAAMRGPAETLARMAQVVGVTADQLEEAGRPDAAAELRALQPRPRTTEDDVIESSLSPETKEALLSIRGNLQKWAARRDEARIRRAQKIMEIVEDDQDTA